VVGLIVIDKLLHRWYKTYIIREALIFKHTVVQIFSLYASLGIMFEIIDTTKYINNLLAELIT
jgi:hypothetical protein